MKKHVLLVAQEMEELKHLVEALDETGLDYKCTWSQSEAQALHQLQYLQPDYILISSRLSEAQVLELISTIQSMPHLLRTQLLMFVSEENRLIADKAAALATLSTVQYAADSFQLAENISRVLAGSPAGNLHIAS